MYIFLFQAGFLACREVIPTYFLSYIEVIATISVVENMKFLVGDITFINIIFPFYPLFY